ncbi:MAG: Holliday junction branch migration protein RuvA [Nitrospirae bacterium]|nr:MAG: Holliday junction branch migration protein RuvA [Nitrospirota bacterium]
MIAGLTGRLITKSPSCLILDVHGVGYEVFIPLSTYFALPDLHETLSLHVHTQLRENGIQLFGFLTPQEKEAFLLLTAISGVGGKLALSILSTLSVPDLITAIQANDLTALTTVPGIGKKSASRIVLELKDKLARHPLGSDHSASPASTPPEVIDDAISALTNLGYRAREVTLTVTQISRRHRTPLALPDLIREALKDLSARR